MTEGQKTQIANLRGEGYGYVRIAQALGISENTVKSFCRRKKLTGKAASQTMPAMAGMGSISALAVGKKWRRLLGGRRKSSARTDAGTNGGTAILTG